MRQMQTYADTPSVTSAVLKAISELVLNKGQRIVFGPSSANGILLFREASQLLAGYGNRILGYMPVSLVSGWDNTLIDSDVGVCVCVCVCVFVHRIVALLQERYAKPQL